MQLRREARPDSSADPQKKRQSDKKSGAERWPGFCLRCIYQSIKTGQKALKKKKKEPIPMHKRVGFHVHNC